MSVNYLDLGKKRESLMPLTDKHL